MRRCCLRYRDVRSGDRRENSRGIYLFPFDFPCTLYNTCISRFIALSFLRFVCVILVPGYTSGLYEYRRSPNYNHNAYIRYARNPQDRRHSSTANTFAFMYRVYIRDISLRISRATALDRRVRSTGTCVVAKKSSRPPCERVFARGLPGEITKERGKSCCESKHASLLFYRLRNGA